MAAWEEAIAPCGTHYMKVTSYVLYHDKCATSTKCYVATPVDTQQ
jgi:hypothetical protein